MPSYFTTSGFLTFGKDEATLVGVKYTPLITISYSKLLYGILLEDITFNGILLGIPSIAFFIPDTVNDSGTPITQLPQTTYNALSCEFRKQMRFFGYLLLPSSNSQWDTCNDLMGKTQMYILRISFVFVDGITLELDPTGILYVFENSTTNCLAFSGVPDNIVLTILGDFQQRKMEVIHDVGGRRIRFRPSPCV
ncbi:hypothetical protein FEM48_Zijuj05G0025100 [Ziziphus jujuba var. spinosa]|uniref:Peptidase A1 domain-containing protein n=1 Tax=Ziziphus jujuba var. spinosa TaxID=714518 RepID=A0A978VCA7_ZIZJJ|nr:hypothetical protein FEM48_Zijuj05G0025100 [Ziziphus jujuba var. spinosa]